MPIITQNIKCHLKRDRKSLLDCSPEGDEGWKGNRGARGNTGAEHLLVITDQVEIVCLLGVLNNPVQPVQQLLAVVHAQLAVLRKAWDVAVDVVGIAY